MRRLFLAPLALLLALSGCDFETSIPINPPPFEEGLVVYAFPTPDSVWTVSVGKALPLGNQFDYEVTGATVTILEDGAVLETLVSPAGTPDDLPTYGNQLATYISASGATPEAGRTYRIEVTAPGLPSASAETTIPLAPEAEVVSDEWTFFDAQGFYNSRRARIALTDAPGDDIYELALIQRQVYEDGNFNEYQTRFTSVSASFRDGYDLLDIDVAVEGDNEYFGNVVFRDELFRDRRETFDLRFDTYADEFAPEQTFSLTLARVSDSFARYQISRAQQSNNEGNPFAEPTPLYSNVQGGYGVVGSFASVRIAMPTPAPPSLAAR